MKRGDLVTVVIQGDIGKPRPALVIQADAFSEHPSVTIIPTTGTLVDARKIGVHVPRETSSTGDFFSGSRNLTQRVGNGGRVQLGGTAGGHHAGQHVEDSAHAGQPTSSRSMTIVSASAASVHSRKAG